MEGLMDGVNIEKQSKLEAGIMVGNSCGKSYPFVIEGKLVNINTGEVLGMVSPRRRKIKPSCLRVWLKAWLQWYIEDWRYGPTPIRTRKGKAKL